MFENVLFQNRAVETAAASMKLQSMAPAWLLHGPAFSSKLTFALEWARILTCREKIQGKWNCSCESCQSHRILNNPNLILGGAKDFPGEIRVSSNALLEKQDLPRRFHFYRTIKKVLKRMDNLFWDGSETKYKTLNGFAETISEKLELIDPKIELLPLKQLEKIVDEISENAMKLADGLPASGLSVEASRELASWARSTGALGKRVIIIEGADKLLDSARNSLLKILEEPPEDVYFFLLTRHRAAIISTIASRLRPLEFAKRTPEQETKIQSQVFGIETRTSLFYLLSGGGKDLREEAKNFWESANSSSPLPQRWNLTDGDFHPFLEELTECLRSDLKTMGLEQWEHSRLILDSIQAAVTGREVYHLELNTILDSLFLKIRGSV